MAVGVGVLVEDEAVVMVVADPAADLLSFLLAAFFLSDLLFFVPFPCLFVSTVASGKLRFCSDEELLLLLLLPAP